MDEFELLAALNVLVQHGLVDVVRVDENNVDVRLARALIAPLSAR